jgi:hypothetical protein
MKLSRSPPIYPEQEGIAQSMASGRISGPSSVVHYFILSDGTWCEQAGDGRGCYRGRIFLSGFRRLHRYQGIHGHQGSLGCHFQGIDIHL